MYLRACWRPSGGTFMKIIAGLGGSGRGLGGSGRGWVAPGGAHICLNRTMGPVCQPVPMAKMPMLPPDAVGSVTLATVLPGSSAALVAYTYMGTGWLLPSMRSR
jgi:hypothetical protein